MAQIKRTKAQIKKVFKAICEQYQQTGGSLHEICKANNVSVRSFNYWTHKYAELAELYKKTKQEIIDADNPEIMVEAVENSLFKKAIGYTFDEVTFQEVMGKDGQIRKVKKIVKKHVPASDTAMIFYLKNQAPEKWNKENQNANINVNITQKTESELEAEYEKLLNKDDQMPE